MSKGNLIHYNSRKFHTWERLSSATEASEHAELEGWKIKDRCFVKYPGRKQRQWDEFEIIAFLPETMSAQVKILHTGLAEWVSIKWLIKNK